MSGRAGRSLVGVIPVAFVGLFFAYPVVTLLGRGLTSAALSDVFTRSSFRGVLWFTVWQALASTALTVLLGLPLAAVLANYRFRGRAALQAAATVPFVLPTVVVAGAFVGITDRFGLDEGALRLRHTVWIILLAHAFFNIAVVVRTVGGYWRQLDDRPEQAARVLGANPWRTFREITLPRLRPALLAAASLIFLFSFTSFGIILILGGPRRATLETEIFRYAVSRTDISTAAALAVVQLAAVIGLIVANQWLQRRSMGRESLIPDRGTPIATSADRWRACSGAAVTGVFLLVPIAVLIERSFTHGDGYSLTSYRALGDRLPLLPIDSLDAVRNSLQFATAATVIAVVVGGCASLVIVHGRTAFGRLVEVGLLLPLGTSAVTLGFGMLISLDEAPLDLRSSWWIIPIAQSLIGIPFVIRSTVPVLRAIDQRTREAAATLGATPARVRREIDIPVARRALGVGAAFAFAISVGEFGATSFVGRRPDLLTVPLAIERLLSQPGSQLRGQAMALSVILMTITATVTLLVDRRGEGGL